MSTLQALAALALLGQLAVLDPNTFLQKSKGNHRSFGFWTLLLSGFLSLGILFFVAIGG